MLGIDWQTGVVAWKFEDADREFPVLASAAVSADCVIVGGRDKRLRRFDPGGGQVRWTFIAKGRIDSSPVIVGQRVLFGATDGILYAVDLASGKESWRFDTGSSLTAAPAVGDGCLVIGDHDGVIRCFGAPAAPPRKR